MGWSPFRYWWRWAVGSAGVAAGGHDGVGDGGQVVVVQAGDRIAEPDRQAGGEAGRDLQDRGLVAGAGQLAGGQGAGGGLPADVAQAASAGRAGAGGDERGGEVGPGQPVVMVSSWTAAMSAHAPSAPSASSAARSAGRAGAAGWRVTGALLARPGPGRR